MKIRARYAALGLVACAMASAASAEMPLSEGLGEVPGSRLSMRFEVTFMKIDVADVSAWLDAETSTAVAGAIEAGGDDDDVRDAVAELVMNADPVLLSMSYLRDSGHDRLMKGVRRSMEAAMKSGVITEEEMESSYETLATTFAGLVDRGVKKGDVLVYRTDGDVLQLRYVDEAGETLVSETFTGETWTRGMKGSFFGEKSRFRKKLVRSVIDEADDA